MTVKQRTTAILLVAGLLSITSVACGPGLMIPGQKVQSAPADKALITFVRATRYGKKSEFVVWDSDRFMGLLEGGQYFQQVVDPGEHMFIVHAQNWAYIKANLEAGKKYYVLLNVSMGFTHAVAVPVPLTKGQAEYGQAQIDEWMAKLTPITPNEAVAAQFEARRKPQITQAVENGKKPGAKFQYLNAEDFWN